MSMTLVIDKNEVQIRSKALSSVRDSAKFRKKTRERFPGVKTPQTAKEHATG
jgi:hypothetical protein